MEEWHPSSEEESKDEKTPSKKRGRTDFFSSLMERLEALRHKRERPEENEEDDDDEESDPKSKKFSKVGKFLRRMLAKSAEPDVTPAASDTLPAAQETAVVPSEAAALGELKVRHDTETPSANQPEASEVADSPELSTETLRPEEPQARPTSENESHEIDYFNEENTEPQPVDRQGGSVDTEPWRPELQAVAATNPRAAEQVIFERTNETLRTERVAERRDPSLLPLIALEYIGRRRADKKLRKEVVGLEKQVERGQKAQDRLQSMQTAAEPRMNSYEQNLQRLTQKFETSKPSKFEQPVQASKIEIPAQRAPTERMAAERADAIITNSFVEKNYIPDTDRLAELHTRPEVVLKQVVEAAEHDVAVEKAYERRQEVKDEPGSGTMSGGGAQAIGAVMAANLANNPILQSQHHATIKMLADTADQRKADQQSLYKRAATAGAASAGVIIIFGLLAMILMR